MFLWALFLALIISVVADCPNGYKQTSTQDCFKIFTDSKTRADAATACQANGGYLANIPNSITNTMIGNDAESENLQAIWIGLTCSGNSSTTCKFDGTTDFLTKASQTYFYPNNPNPNVGTCVYMITAGTGSLKWFSADCYNNPIPYACTYDPQLIVDDCPNGYTFSNNECYKVVAKTDEATAEAICEADCGHITSVHSHDENVFILNLATNYSSMELYARIGLKEVGNNNTYSWLDGSPLGTYSNFGLGVNSNLGNCVGMSLKDDVIKSGEWINTKCEHSLISVCKRDPGYACLTTTYTPTLSSNNCTSPYVNNANNGTIYSPGYPFGTSENKCEYLIIAQLGYVVRIRFTTLILDCSSYIELYNDLADTVPFANFTTTNPNYYYYSSENEMKMIFHSSRGLSCSIGDLWIAEYDSVQAGSNTTTGTPGTSGCNGGLLMAPGTITSPNYPNNYPIPTGCEYLLGAPGNQHVILHFSEINTKQETDIITIYDGPNKNSPVLARLSGINPTLNDYKSSGNRMYLTFNTDTGISKKGFSASFINSS